MATYRTQRIGVVSDTHGHVLNTRKAVVQLTSLEVDVVLHCGDIGSPEIPPLFAAWPAHFVFGNVDWDDQGLRTVIEAHGMTCHGRFASLNLGGRNIAVLHGDDEQRLREECLGGQWDLICYGHTHQAEYHRAGATLLLNPGAIYRARPHTIAVVSAKDLTVNLVDIG